MAHKPPASLAPHPQFAFICGVEWEVAALAISRHADAMHEKRTGPMVNGPIVPSLSVCVVAAFGLELYLKCLNLLDNGKAPFTHALLDLFDALPAARRDQIEKAHASIVATEDDGENDQTPQTARDKLVLANDLFDRWRYAYELRSIERQFSCGAVIVAVRRVILQEKPGWAWAAAQLESDA